MQCGRFQKSLSATIICSAKFCILYIWVDSQNLPQPFIQTKNDRLRGWREKTVEQFSCHIRLGAREYSIMKRYMYIFDSTNKID